jgi:malate permease and related proteins
MGVAMPDWLIVLVKVAGMFLAMVVGWLAMRRGRLSAETTQTMSRFVVDVALPALIVGQMVSSVDGVTLRAGFLMPILAVVVTGAGALLGWASAPLFTRRGEQRRTYIFLAAIGNWIYLPLPIAAALFGDAGKLAVLLYNVGGMVLLWTLGVWILRGGRPGIEAGRQLLKNPGLLATFGGIALAFSFPEARHAASLHATQPALLLAAAIFSALDLVGSLTIPLSLVLIGAQLATMRPAGAGRLRPVLGVLICRLLLTPVVVVAVVTLLAACGVHLSEPARICTYLIAGMPVALNCAMFAERYDGDVELAARAIFATTLASVLTTPAQLFAVRALGL